MEQFLILVSQEGELYMASVFPHNTGKPVARLSWGVGPNRDDAIYDAVVNAFFDREDV